MKKVILFIMGMLCGTMSLYAQSPPEIKPLTIGDTVPDIVFHHMLNYKDTTAKFSDFRGKLVILDFFATWCGSCIAALPKLDSLQKQYHDHIQILTVDYESQAVVSAYLQNNPIGKRVSMPFVTEDSCLSKLFPHKLIPHEVWIGREGTVRAITYAEYVTARNIKHVLKDKKWSLPAKRDLMGFDADKPLFQDGNGGDKNKLICRSVFAHYLNGISRGWGHVRDTGNGLLRIYYINLPILALYASAFKHYSNRVVLEVNNKSRYIYIRNKQLWTTWMQKNSYCYELTIPASMSPEKIRRIMSEDLNRYLDLNGRIEERMVKCWVLIRSNASKGLLKPGTGKREAKLYGNNSETKYIHNCPISTLIDALNYYNPGGQVYPVVIDETHYKGNISLDLNVKSIHDIPAMRGALQSYGLDLIQVKRKLKVFVLTEKDYGLHIDQ